MFHCGSRKGKKVISRSSHARNGFMRELLIPTVNILRQWLRFVGLNNFPTIFGCGKGAYVCIYSTSKNCSGFL